MPTVVAVTKRQIKNVNTGTDINVPSFQKASSPRNVKDYHVVVISRLPHFKLPEHSEDDVVQFMVPRDYNAFEKLQKELLEQFPSLKIPDLPRKHVLFMSEEDLEDRRVSFDCLMTIVSRSTRLVTSIPILQFLGIDLLADRKYTKRRAEYLKSKETKSSTEKEEEDEDIFGEKVSPEVIKSDAKTSPDEDNDLFSEEVITKTSITSSNDDKDLFESEPISLTRTPKLSLLVDDNDITPTVLESEDTTKENLFAVIEDNSELLNVSDTLDDVLNISKEKPKRKPKPAIKAKPLGLSLFEEEDTSANLSKMGTDDITKYIQQNQSKDDDDELDLFN